VRRRGLGQAEPNSGDDGGALLIGSRKIPFDPAYFDPEYDEGFDPEALKGASLDVEDPALSRKRERASAVESQEARRSTAFVKKQMQVSVHKKHFLIGKKGEMRIAPSIHRRKEDGLTGRRLGGERIQELGRNSVSGDLDHVASLTGEPCHLKRRDMAEDGDRPSPNRRSRVDPSLESRVDECA